MTASLVQIYNLALTRVGSTVLVTSTTEATLQAQLCTALFDQSRDFVLRDYPWRFAKLRATLSLITGTTDHWAYQYTKPADCLRVRFLSPPAVRTPLVEKRVPFELATNGTLDVIYTDLASAMITYTQRVTDPARFDPTFVSALGFHLAAELAVPLRGKPDIAVMMGQAYNAVVQQAAAASLSEGYDEAPDNSFLTARTRNNG